MKRLLYVIFTIVFLAAQPSYAQRDISDLHQKTTTPGDARYEILQSQLAAKWTFRLDRFSGRVWQLLKTPTDGNAWEEMPVQGLTKITNPNKPRFLLFTSGIAARHTFLMDSLTGKTWVVTSVDVSSGEGKAKTINVWQPFED
jgi:hypothetical protein